MKSRRRTASKSTPRGPAPGTFELEVTDMAIDGDALGRVGGYVVLVEGVIPGERALVRSVSAARKFGRAELIRVLRPSPHRVAPRCRHFGSCGGCAWQHIAYPEQLRIKQKMLASLLENALEDDAPPVLPVLGIASGAGGEAPWGFRNKVHFAIGRGPGGGLIMGHYRRGSRDLFDAIECPVHAEDGNR
ncbi:MAG TPA: TRAM domain-containing protein, partial [Planctomycetota bacterium]|nr:TRAM domain-containing protein [Planctomycetota bacterium]